MESENLRGFDCRYIIWDDSGSDYKPSEKELNTWIGKILKEKAMKAHKNEINSFRIGISFEWDWKFFAITPAINLNFHSKTFEFEWLFLGIYTERIP